MSSDELRKYKEKLKAIQLEFRKIRGNLNTNHERIKKYIYLIEDLKNDLENISTSSYQQKNEVTTLLESVVYFGEHLEDLIELIELKKVEKNIIQESIKVFVPNFLSKILSDIIFENEAIRDFYKKITDIVTDFINNLNSKD